VYADGRAVVTVPPGVAEPAVRSFVESKTDWVVAKRELFQKRGVGEQTLPYFGAYESQKKEALEFVIVRLRHFNASYGFPIGRVSVRDQKTRWGSCSRAGNLSFNYRIASLPEELADYVIVHELCHLKEFNHATSFWELVSRVFPNHRSLRRQLRGYSAYLYAV
jgi:predicted metal-dependent hydrolase